MKALKILYYISVICLSVLTIFFCAALYPWLLTFVIPMSCFLFLTPYVYKKTQSKQIIHSEIPHDEVEQKESAENGFASAEMIETENPSVEDREDISEKVEKQESCETEISSVKANKDDTINETQEVVSEEAEEEETEKSILELLLEHEYQEELKEIECADRKEYIFMRSRAYTKHGTSLSSERFSSKADADYFAEAFKHNYTSIVRVLEVKGGGYGVFADFVPEYLIRSNYQREYDGYIFSNFKNEQRRNLPAPPKEHIFDKYPKYEKILTYGVVTWPILALVNFIEWLSGAARIPADNVQVRVSAQELANMSGADFEQYVGRRLKGMGYKNVRVTQASGDFGADVVAVDSNGQTVCIQCKHYSKPVGIKAVQEIYSAKQYYKCQNAMVITNSTYTRAAIDLANKTGVDLWANFR